MAFSNIIGQDKVKQMLHQMVLGDRLPHALLFLGPSGSGKLALALALAQYLLCENRQDGDSCGQCASCSKSHRFIHPDLHFSFPTIGTNVTSDSFLPQWRKWMADNPYLTVNEWLQSIGAENRQGNINKEECAAIIRKLSLKIFEGSHKILIMWLPEYLGKEGNRLLKLIEEPPEDTIFILVAENQELILNTILSRCQIVKINALPDDDIVEGLIKVRQLDIETARAVAHLANGDFNEALQLAGNQENDNAALFLDWMRKCYIGNGPELVEWVDNFATLGRENQKYFLNYALHFMREYMVLKLTGNDQVRLRPNELKTAKNLVKVIEMDQLERMVQLLTDCAYYVERNAHPKVLFLDTSIQMNKLLKRNHMDLNPVNAKTQ